MAAALMKHIQKERKKVWSGVRRPPTQRGEWGPTGGFPPGSAPGAWCWSGTGLQKRARC